MQVVRIQFLQSSKVLLEKFAIIIIIIRLKQRQLLNSSSKGEIYIRGDYSIEIQVVRIQFLQSSKVLLEKFTIIIIIIRLKQR